MPASSWVPTVFLDCRVKSHVLVDMVPECRFLGLGHIDFVFFLRRWPLALYKYKIINYYNKWLTDKVGTTNFDDHVKQRNCEKIQ